MSCVVGSTCSANYGVHIDRVEVIGFHLSLAYLHENQGHVDDGA